MFNKNWSLGDLNQVFTNKAAYYTRINKMYTDKQCTLTPWRQQPGGNHAEISHVTEPKSRHVVNMVTYIIYINKKRQNNKPEKNNYLQALPWIRRIGAQTAAQTKRRPATAGTLGERWSGGPSAQVLTCQIMRAIELPPNQKRERTTGKKRLKGHGPGHTQCTRLHIYISTKMEVEPYIKYARCAIFQGSKCSSWLWSSNKARTESFLMVVAKGSAVQNTIALWNTEPHCDLDQVIEW